MHARAHVRMHITAVRGPAKMKRIQQSVIADFLSGSQSDSHDAPNCKYVPPPLRKDSFLQT